MGNGSTNTLTMHMDFQYDTRGLSKFESDIGKIAEKFENVWSDVWKSTNRQFDLFMSGMATDVVKTWNDAEKTVVDSTKNALKGTVSAAFDGEMDKVGDIWEKSWDDMGTKLEGLWDKLLGAPLDRALTGVQNMFKELVFDPVSDWFTGLFSGDGWAKAAPAEATFTPA